MGASETVTLLSIGSRDVWIPGKEAIADLGLIERMMQRKKTLDADASQRWRGTKNAWRQVAQEESEQFPLLLWLLRCLAASLLLFLDAYSKQCETLAQSEQDALSWKEKMKKWKATAQEKAKAASSKIRALSPTSLRLPPTKSAADIAEEIKAGMEQKQDDVVFDEESGDFERLFAPSFVWSAKLMSPAVTATLLAAIEIGNGMRALLLRFLCYRLLRLGDYGRYSWENFMPGCRKHGKQLLYLLPTTVGGRAAAAVRLDRPHGEARCKRLRQHSSRRSEAFAHQHGPLDDRPAGPYVPRNRDHVRCRAGHR